MSEQTNRERFYFMKSLGVLNGEPEERVRHLVNMLIDGLYIPVEGNHLTEVDWNRVGSFGIDETEPINWADLSCREVKEFKNQSFLVVIDEAEPNDCPTLCEYIRKFMASYGWECDVKTEW